MTAGINRSIQTRASKWRSHDVVVAFRSATEATAIEELERQVSIARQANVLGVQDFDDQYWPIASRALTCSPKLLQS